MSESADHHYVPRFYLARWAGLDHKLAVYSRIRGRVILSKLNPRSTGFERDLYALNHVRSGARQNLERGFFTEKIDTPASRAMGALLSNPARPLTNAERVSFSHFLMSLRARHPDAINRAKDQSDDLLLKALDDNPEEYERLRGRDDPSKASEWVFQNRPDIPANFALGSIERVIANPLVGERIFSGVWWVADLRKARLSLLTSDRPCILAGNAVSGPFCMALPLSPKHVFVVADNTEVIRRLDRLDRTALVKFVNRSVVGEASKYVYGIDGSHLALAEKLLLR